MQVVWEMEVLGQAPRVHVLTIAHWEDTEEITPQLRTAAEYLSTLARYLPERIVHVAPAVAAPVLVYTDAAADATRIRVGGLVLVPGCRPRALVHVPPAEAREVWGRLDHVIAQAELHAARSSHGQSQSCSATATCHGISTIPWRGGYD